MGVAIAYSLEDIRNIEERKEYAAAHTDNQTSPDGCWPWTGPRSPYGYGIIHVGVGKRYRSLHAHRFAYLIANSCLPTPPLIVRHLCEANYTPGNVLYRLCCNPAHLKEGTARDNSADMKAAGRAATGARNGDNTHPESRPRGQNHPNAKYSDDVVKNIYVLRSAGLSQAAIATQLSVPERFVWEVVNGVTRRHLIPETGLPESPDLILRGEDNPSAVITWEDVDLIRDLYEKGMGGPTIAEQLGISRSTVYRVLRGETWRRHTRKSIKQASTHHVL